jgi:hypothetical protein
MNMPDAYARFRMKESYCPFSWLLGARLVVPVAVARPARQLRVRVPGATVPVVRAGRRRSRTRR